MKLTKKLRFSAITCVLVLTIGCGFCVRGENVDPTASREWRAYGGHTLTAEFVELKGDAVVLKGADGSVRNVPLRMLIPEDQALAKELGARIAAGATFAVKAGSGKRLAEFTEGPGKGSFAFYENEKFIVRISPTARIHIQCLEDGKPVGKPIAVLMGHNYKHPETRLEQFRQIVSFAEAYYPVLQPDAVTLEGVLTDDVPFGFTLAFEGQSIHVSGWAEDSAGSGGSKEYTPAIRFAASHQFEAHVLVVDQKKALESFWLDINPLRGRAFKQPYGDMPKGINMALRTVDIRGDVFGSRRLSVSVGPSRLGEMHLITRTPIFNGFELCLEKRNPALRDPTCRITLTID